MKTIITLNQKGGVAKTTTSTNIAVGFAKRGYRTLEVDLDPQANSTDVFANATKFDFEKFLQEKIKKDDYTLNDFAADFDRESERKYDISDLLLDAKLTKETILKTRYKNLDIIPSSINLSLTDTKIKLNQNMPQHNRLKKVLDEVKGDYDYCVVDCPPILNVLTVNALVACDEVIIPIKVDAGAIKGFLLTLENIFEIMENFGIRVKVTILFTMVNRNNVDKLLIQLIKKICNNQVFDTTIRTQAKAITKASFEQTIVIDDDKEKVSNDYSALVEEILRSHGKEEIK